MQNGMAMDFSWKSSARQYLDLYEKTLAGKQQAAGSGQEAAGSRQKTEDSKRRKN
jgi:hypothetical protein